MTPTSPLDDLLRELAEVRGIDFRGYKTSSLQRRLRKRMEQLHLADYSEYRKYLQEHPSEVNDLLSTVLINVTEFFRDPQAWHTLRDEVFPKVFSKFPRGSTFRAWCAGCASGEEVYSLAILLAEHFGARLNDYEIKIYATDNDPEALNVARRAEYSAESLRLVPAELREKYFAGTKLLRVKRDLRRLAIFGRSNLVSDAPISRVRLLICRNVLIYFDAALQRQVLERFRFALDEGGILFLGKSESQLYGSATWRVVNPKWRIFQRVDGNFGGRRGWEDDLDLDKTRQEYESLRLYQRHLLETLRPGVLMLNAEDVVTAENESALSLFGLGSGVRLAGQRMEHTPLASRCPELATALERSHSAREATRFQTKIEGQHGEAKMLSVTIRPMMDDKGHRSGTLIYAEDITTQEKLRSTVEELETTAEELHSTNEELETTNEELQSSNEELETTNEELQSTNEELETTNEELQSLNEELETANTELESRTREVDTLNEHFAQTLSAMPMPVIVLNQEMAIELWNSEAERLFGFPVRTVMGMRLNQMPIEEGLRKALLKAAKVVVATGEQRLLRKKSLNTESFRGVVDIHLTPLEGTSPGVLLLVETSSTSKQQARAVSLARAVAKKGLRPTAAKAKSKSAPTKKKSVGKRKGRK